MVTSRHGYFINLQTNGYPIKLNYFNARAYVIDCRVLVIISIKVGQASFNVQCSTNFSPFFDNMLYKNH